MPTNHGTNKTKVCGRSAATVSFLLTARPVLTFFRRKTKRQSDKMAKIEKIIATARQRYFCVERSKNEELPSIEN